MTPAPRIGCLALALTLAFAASGCHRDASTDATSQDAALPAPDSGNGSVTGMPDRPGPGAIGTPAPAAVATIADANAADPGSVAVPTQGIAVGEQNPATPPGNGGIEPGPEDATQVVRDYYAAINGHDYGTAYRLWADGGRASHQSAQQFANGFADTTGVNVEIGVPGDEDAGAGQRYIEIPVTIAATHADGSRHRFAGSYTLHRTVVDGASADERAWRIDSAKLRETAP